MPLTPQLQAVWRTVRYGRFSRSVGVLAGASAIAQGVSVLASPLLTRLYTPADFGVLAVFTALLSVGGVIACLRFESAIPVPVEDHAARSVLHLALVVAVGMASLSALVVWASGERLAAAFDIAGHAGLLWLLPLGVLLMGSYEALSRWAVRVRDFSTLARTKLMRSASAVTVQVGLGVAVSGSPVWLVLGSIAGQSAGILTLARRLQPTSPPPRAGEAPGLLATASRYRRFPLLSAPSGVLNTVTLHAPTVIIAATFGPIVAGLYALTQRVLGLPMVLLGTAISDVFLGDAAAARRAGDLERLRTLFSRTVVVLTVASVTIVGGVALVAPSAFAFVFGDTWREAGEFVRALAPMYAMGFVAAPFGGLLAVLERQDLFLFREITRAGLVIGSLAIAQVLGATPLQSMTALGLAGAVGYLTYILVSWSALAAHGRRPGRGA